MKERDLMSYPESKLTGLTGFALAAKVTGGWAGQVVSITTLDQLKANIGDTTPRVLVINSNISAASLTKVNMGANKTLIGSFQNRTLENIHCVPRRSRRILFCKTLSSSIRQVLRPMTISRCT